MPGDVLSALIYLIDALSKAGLVSVQDLAQLLGSLGRNMFICGQHRMDYSMIAEALKRGPVVLECDRRRAHQIAKRAAELLKKKVHKARIGHKIQPVYILFTRDHASEIAEMAVSEDAPECLRKALQELYGGEGSGK